MVGDRLLFIGFAYHLKTGSADFLLELLGKRYEVTTHWVDLYLDNPYQKLCDIAGAYDVLVCWQVRPPRAELDKYFTFLHAAFFPMFDGCPSVKKPEKWYPYRDFQIISFSSLLCRQLQSAGFSAHYIQYFPQPVAVQDWGAKDSAFLWARREEINCDLVQELLGASGLKRMHVHNSPDPGFRFIPPSDPDSLEYSYSTWFDEKSDLERKMIESAFYVAPRRKEGIGMSFLEAMAAGRCVIAPDHATMNEYIVHGSTGYLYDLTRPKPLRIKDVREIQQQAHNFISEGFVRWERDKNKIFDWVSQPPVVSKKRIFLRMAIRFFRNPGKVLRVLRGDP